MPLLIAVWLWTSYFISLIHDFLIYQLLITKGCGEGWMCWCRRKVPSTFWDSIPRSSNTSPMHAMTSITKGQLLGHIQSTDVFCLACTSVWGNLDLPTFKSQKISHKHLNFQFFLKNKRCITGPVFCQGNPLSTEDKISPPSTHTSFTHSEDLLGTWSLLS